MYNLLVSIVGLSLIHSKCHTFIPFAPTMALEDAWGVMKSRSHSSRRGSPDRNWYRPSVRKPIDTKELAAEMGEGPSHAEKRRARYESERGPIQPDNMSDEEQYGIYLDYLAPENAHLFNRPFKPFTNYQQFFEDNPDVPGLQRSPVKAFRNTVGVRRTG